MAKSSKFGSYEMYKQLSPKGRKQSFTTKQISAYRKKEFEKYKIPVIGGIIAFVLYKLSRD